MLHDGQRYAAKLHYAPLPGAIIQREEAQLELVAARPAAGTSH
jgi:hypothetical protein